MELPPLIPTGKIWMIVNVNTTRQIKEQPVGIVRNPKKQPKCVYYEKERALKDLADLKAKFPEGAFYLLESIE